MNISNLTAYLQLTGYKSIILVIYLFVATFIACHNWLYLYHSLHVSSKHMGLNSPPYVRRIIKINITISVFTVLLIIFFLILGIS